MSPPAPSPARARSQGPPAALFGAVAAVVPGIAIRLTGLGGHGAGALAAPLAAALYGLAVVGASFLLAWAAEAVQLDISPAVAIGALALVTVLPEYVVGNVFAWRGGKAAAAFGGACQSAAARLAGHQAPCALSLANMLGANRLLLGVGWGLVVLLAWHRRRTPDVSGTQRRGGDRRAHSVSLGREHSVELSFLALATLWCLFLPLRRTLTAVDAAVLFVVFVGYGIRVAQAPGEEPELEGAAEWVGRRPAAQRRALALILLVVAGGAIVVCADAFADSLVASGSVLGVDESFLIQWVAPLASEAPELLIASIYAWRLRAATGLGALVSSKVNQWTILVGSLPLTFALANHSFHGLPLAVAQRQEIALTAAQSVFGVAVLGNLDVSTPEAVALVVLFAGEFASVGLAPTPWRGALRLGFMIAYLVAGVAILVIKRRDTVTLLRDGFRTPYAELGGTR